MLLRNITIYTRVAHIQNVKQTLIRTTITSILITATQPQYNQSETAKLGETVRNDHKVTYQR